MKKDGLKEREAVRAELKLVRGLLKGEGSKRGGAAATRGKERAGLIMELVGGKDACCWGRK